MPTPSNRTLRLGTRGSALAMVQARAIARALIAAGHSVEIVVKQTIGDLDKKSAFAAIGPPGVFVREIETALLEGELDVAVHCYKDLPSLSPEGLIIAAVPPREDPGELLLIQSAAFDPTQSALPLTSGAVVGTSAARRQALITRACADVECRELRGNVPTRIAKLRAGDYDAIVLAAAGINRLRAGAERGENPAPELAGLEVHALPPTTFVPAPSQGALALQVRADDAAARAAVQALHDPDTERTVRAERHLLKLVQAGCEAPIGAFARVCSADSLELFGFFEHAGVAHRTHHTGPDPRALAEAAFAAFDLPR